MSVRIIHNWRGIADDLMMPLLFCCPTLRLHESLNIKREF